MNVNAIITNFNNGNFLEGCILSLRNQYHSTGIAVFDDASTDSSRDVLFSFLSPRSLYKEEGNLSYYREGRMTVVLKTGECAGPSAGRNVLIRELWDETEAFLIQDADDESLPNKVEELLKPIRQYPDSVGLTYGDYIIENVETGVRTVEYKWPFNRDELYKHCIIHSQSLISKKALQAVDNSMWYDESMRTCEDYMLWVKIIRKMMAIKVPKVLSVVRVHANNSTNSVRNEIWQQNWQKVRNEILNG